MRKQPIFTSKIYGLTVIKQRESADGNLLHETDEVDGADNKVELWFGFVWLRNQLCISNAC